MNRQTLGVASSVSYERSFDPFDTLSFAREAKIGFVQPYMDDRFRENGASLDRFAQEAHDSDIRIVCHGPGLLCSSSTNESLIASVTRLFIHQGNPSILLHHDSNLSVAAGISCLKKINEAGVAVQLENFYDSKIDIVSCVDTYCALLLQAVKENVRIVPVLDIPRLFINHISSVYDSLALTCRILDTVASAGVPLILHVIDTHSSDQLRASWCPVGQGCILYTTIAEQIRIRKIQIECIILEFEEKPMVLESINFLEKTFLRRTGLFLITCLNVFKIKRSSMTKIIGRRNKFSKNPSRTKRRELIDNCNYPC